MTIIKQTSNSKHCMSDNRTSVDGHELNQSLSSPQIHQNPLHSIVSRLRPPPVEQVGYCKHASFADTVASTQHSIGSIATPSTTYFALRFAAATDDVHEFRWCSWFPRNGRHCVLMFLKFPSIISQLYIWRVRLVRHLP